MSYIKKYCTQFIIVSLLLTIIVLLGMLYTNSATHITKIVGTYCVGPNEGVQRPALVFEDDTYTFLMDGTYLKYGHSLLLETGTISHEEGYVFRLTSTKGEVHEIMFIDQVVYEQDASGLYAKYLLLTELPAVQSQEDGFHDPIR